MNEEIAKLLEQIKNRLKEHEMTELTLYASDYCGELDEELVEEKVEDPAAGLGFIFNMNIDYSGDSGVDTLVRKIKVKDDDLFFDLETVYSDTEGGWESTGYYEDQDIKHILLSCPEKMVLDGLKGIINIVFDSDYYDIIGLNKL